MTPEEFVEAVRAYVMEAAATSVVEDLEKPIGHPPRQALLRLSEWYNGLNETDKLAVAEVARMGSHAALFRLFCVLDGAAVIEDGPDKGEFHLLHVKNGQRTVLSPAPREFLHDLLNSGDIPPKLVSQET